VQNQSDGEIFFHIINGVRHTGMPGWTLPDRQAWQLVRYIRHLPGGVALAPRSATQESINMVGAHFVGSQACRNCHAEIYNRWKTTRMANAG